MGLTESYAKFRLPCDPAFFAEVGLPIPWLLKNAIESSNEEWHGVSIRQLRRIT